MTFLKQEDKNLAKNYRPVSVLYTLSKVFEKIMQKQVMNYINTFLPPISARLQKRVQYSIRSFVIARKMKKDH